MSGAHINLVFDVAPLAHQFQSLWKLGFVSNFHGLSLFYVELLSQVCTTTPN